MFRFIAALAALAAFVVCAAPAQACWSTLKLSGNQDLPARYTPEQVREEVRKVLESEAREAEAIGVDPAIPEAAYKAFLREKGLSIDTLTRDTFDAFQTPGFLMMVRSAVAKHAHQKILSDDPAGGEAVLQNPAQLKEKTAMALRDPAVLRRGLLEAVHKAGCIDNEDVFMTHFASFYRP